MNQLIKRQKELLLNNKEDLKAIVYAYDADRLVLFDEFVKQFEEKKDWEIISYKNLYDGIHVGNENCTKYLCDIHSIKYKDQVFTIGDKTDKGEIGAFVLRENELKVHVLHGALFDISEVKKVERKPLFVTEDGIDVYVDDEVFQVSLVSNYTLSKMIYRETVPIPPPSYFKYFKSKEKAEEFIELNSPKLSVNEVKEELHNKYGERNETCNNILKRLISLVKSKSK